MSTRLKNVKIKCISILTDEKKPANGLGVIVKDDSKDDSYLIEMDIHKFDPEGFLVIRPMISKVEIQMMNTMRMKILLKLHMKQLRIFRKMVVLYLIQITTLIFWMMFSL